MTDHKKALVSKLTELGKKQEEYHIVDGFAFYKGSPVHYPTIKINFARRVAEVYFSKDPEKTVTVSTSTETKEETPLHADIEVSTVSSSSLSSSTSPSFSSFEEAKFKNLKMEDITIKDEEVKAVCENIGIFFNLNGISKSRTNLIIVNRQVFKIGEVTTALGISDHTFSDKERTIRSALTVERIASCFAEETAKFLKKHEELSKIKPLKHLGFTKSFFCDEVLKDKNKIKEVYREYVLYARSWKITSASQNPRRFAEKMKYYYTTVLGISSEVFEEVEKELSLIPKTQVAINPIVPFY